MERFGSLKPIQLKNVERKQKLSAHKIVNPRYQGEVIPECLVQNSKKFINKTKRGNFMETSSSSSSSSSSSTSTSESEEEFTQQVPLRKSLRRDFQKHQQRLLQQTTPREWYTVVSLEGLIRPTQVTAKLNPKCHILVIKAKQNVNNVPLKREEISEQLEDALNPSAAIDSSSSGKIVRVIPLPQNIHLHQIKVQITPNGQQIIVKAPFVLPGEELQEEEKEEEQTRYSSAWVPIRVTVKDISVEALNYPQYLLPRRSAYELERVAPHPRESTQKERQGIYYTPSKQWQTISLNREQQHQRELPQTWGNNKFVRPECIRDPVTGKLAMLVKVNTVGFLPEEVVVRVDQTRGILIVEANKKQEQYSVDRREASQQQQQVLEQGLPMKCLRREFVLPQWLDITHIGYRVLQDGILTIKLPIIKLSKANKLRELDEVDVEGQQPQQQQQQQQVKNLNWETPLSA